MRTTTYHPVNSVASLSSVDALWALIMQQGKNTRRILTERLMAADVESAEQLLLRASVRRGWEQVQAMEQSGIYNNGTLQNLIDELSGK